MTIILTYRNRDLKIVKQCLQSLNRQISKDFKVILVDYGSTLIFEQELQDLAGNYNFITLLRCDTVQQLWCKSRAINIALKQIETPYCFVGDIDMIYHPECVETLHAIKAENKVTYFQVGFLDEKESKQNKDFSDYKINFKSEKEATGMTLYPTALLKSINGYDEFYNGWGSEDTDVHVRLKNAEQQVDFYTARILMLHQWHPKHYRKKNDLTPFHSTLELINASYLQWVAITKKTKANTIFDYGFYNKESYKGLNTIDEQYSITNKTGELAAFINTVLLVKKKTVVKLNIQTHKEFKSLKQNAKALLNKKTIVFTEMQTINDNLLESIISHLRNQPYRYQFNSVSNTISLIIKL